MINRRAVRRNINRFADGLVASYCKGCGLLIAASPKRKTLDVMEDVHRCPVYFHYQQTPEPVDKLDAWPAPMGRVARILVYLK
jgi:hypothetical protein